MNEIGMPRERIRPPRLGGLLVAALAALVLAACGGSGAGSTDIGPIDWTVDGIETGPQIGQRAPNFRLETAAGDTLALEEHLGRPVVLNFWATWCANCREELGILQAAGDAGATVIGIDLRESAEKVQAIAAETGATYPMALDRKGEVNRAYRVTSLPVTYVLDAEGTVREIIRGPVEGERLQAVIAAAAQPGGAT